MSRISPADSSTNSNTDRFMLVLPLRFGLAGAAIGVVVGFVVEALTTGLLPAPSAILLTLGRMLLAAGLTGLLGGAVGAGVGYLLQRRLHQMLALTDAWIRGNLALRTTASRHDELGQIEYRLNLIIEHLEEDEQDLDRLRESNIRLTDQVRALAVVEERNRLARELHDSVKQHLFSLAMTASAVRTHLAKMEKQRISIAPGLTEMVHEMETAAQTAQRETTRLIEDLRPAPLQERGLAAALNDYTLLFGAQQHLLVYLDVHCNEIQLPPIVTETLYRVAQEALHNIARHARATRVDVALHCTHSRVTLTVEDNGCGFDTRRTQKGLGISSMHERLMTVGGRLQVESDPGSGTTIRAEVDIPEPTVAATAVKPAGTSTYVARLRTEAWGWLGQRLMIPVGQMWPWPPAEQERHLRAPLVEPGSYFLKREHRFLGLILRFSLLSKSSHMTLMHLHPEHSGVGWEESNAHWALRRITGRQGRAILERNEQPLAALQHRSHQLDVWTDIVYDDRFYCLTATEPSADDLAESSWFVLTDESNTVLAEMDNTDIHLRAPLPLPLLMIITARLIEEDALRPSLRKQEAAQIHSESNSADRTLRLGLQRKLRATIRDTADTLPGDVVDKVNVLAQTICAILPQLKNIDSSDQDTFTIRQTILDYLPTALADYTALPADFAAGEPIQDGKTAREHLIHQIELLQQAVDAIAARVLRQDTQHLLSHGRFLAGKFEKGGDPSVTE